MKKIIFKAIISLSIIFICTDLSATALKFNGNALKENKIRSKKPSSIAAFNTTKRTKEITYPQKDFGISLDADLSNDSDDCSNMGLDTGYRIEKIYTTSLLAATAFSALLWIFTKTSPPQQN